MTLSTGLGDPGQIFPNVDNWRTLSERRKKRLSLNIQALATCSGTLLWHPSYFKAKVKLLWRKDNLCVQHFTRDGKETDNSDCYSTQWYWHCSCDSCHLKLTLFALENLFLVTLIDHGWSLGWANTTPRLSFETVEDLQRRWQISTKTWGPIGFWVQTCWCSI